jgi:hypothetical protein
MGGTYKSHELLYVFTAPENREKHDEEAAALKDRLVLFPDNLHTSDFLDIIPPAGIQTSVKAEGLEGQELQPVINFFDDNIRSKFLSSRFSGKTFDDLREKRPFTWNKGPSSGSPVNWYGWLEFGGLPRYEGRDASYGFSSQHYGWDYISLIHGLRFQEPDMLELGEQLAYTHGDILVMHDPEGLPMEFTANGLSEADAHGAQKYERDALFHFTDHRGYDEESSTDIRGSAHRWITGLILQYLLTGNEHFMDILSDMGENLLYRFSNYPAHSGYIQKNKSLIYYDRNGGPVSPGRDGESRQYTRSMRILTDLWKVTEKKEYLDVAWGIFENGVLMNEQDNNGILMYPSHHSGTCGEGPCDAHMFYESISIKPLILLYYEMKALEKIPEAEKIRGYLERHAVWMREEVYTNWDGGTACGTYRDGLYFPYTVKLNWKDGFLWIPDGKHTDSSYSLTHADLFAFMYNVTGKGQWLELARRVFRDGFLYNRSGTWVAVKNTDSLKTRGWGFLPDPGWLKSGKIMTKPMYYLKTEWETSGGNN